MPDPIPVLNQELIVNGVNYGTPEVLGDGPPSRAARDCIGYSWPAGSIVKAGNNRLQFTEEKAIVLSRNA